MLLLVGVEVDPVDTVLPVLFDEQTGFLVLGLNQLDLGSTALPDRRYSVLSPLHLSPINFILSAALAKYPLTTTDTLQLTPSEGINLHPSCQNRGLTDRRPGSAPNQG